MALLPPPGCAGTQDTARPQVESPGLFATPTPSQGSNWPPGCRHRLSCDDCHTAGPAPLLCSLSTVYTSLKSPNHLRPDQTKTKSPPRLVHGPSIPPGPWAAAPGVKVRGSLSLTPTSFGSKSWVCTSGSRRCLSVPSSCPLDSPDLLPAAPRPSCSYTLGSPLAAREAFKKSWYNRYIT